MYINRIASVNLSLAGEHMTFIRYTPSGFCFNGWDSRRHSNIRDEVHIILSGSCSLSVEDKTYKLTAGSAFVVRKGLYHAPHDVSDNIERCSFMLDTINSGYLDGRMEQLSGRVLDMPEDIGDLCHGLDKEMRSGLPYCADILQAKLTELMVYLLRQAEPDEVPGAAGGPRTAKQELLIGIDQFFSPWPYALGTEADLSRRLNISRHKLNRIIRQYYGMNFREKLHLSKMDYAAWLLRTTDFPCHQIATLCGYSADTSFYRAFAAYFGIPPLAYRKEKKGRELNRLDSLTDE